MKTPRVSGLYAVTPTTSDTAWLLDKIEQVLQGGARVVQYRHKDLAPECAHAQAHAIAQRCRMHRALYLINDDVALAEEVGADGVHLGRDDMPLAMARARLGPGAIIGASCYNDLARAREAVTAGADYIAFGSFFASRVKPGAVRARVDLLESVRTWQRSVVAIGGIDRENAETLIAHGADAVAVISALFDVEDSAGAARAFVRLFEHQPTIETT